MRIASSLAPDQSLLIDRLGLRKAADRLPAERRALLERTAERIRRFAQAQRDCLRELRTKIPGGEAGHTVVPVERAGCYAPGGRYPLPSSVLMTIIPAQVAGVAEVWVASPRPTVETLAAAAIAGANFLLCAGGAHAIAALAYGAGPVPACDAVVGPGNRWVTAAKQLVAGRVAIDMLAGPSELVVLADQSADAAVVAADLLAQAEHDPEALPVLVAPHAPLIDTVEAELVSQLAGLPTAETAKAALTNGFAVCVTDAGTAAELCNRLAPEHLALHVADHAAWPARLRRYGTLFLGGASAEVLGDYGAGPNHVLPTGGTARFRGGLSVLTFMCVRTWLRIDAPAATHQLYQDAQAMARMEHLEAHARSAATRRSSAMRSTTRRCRPRPSRPSPPT